MKPLVLKLLEADPPFLLVLGVLAVLVIGPFVLLSFAKDEIAGKYRNVKLALALGLGAVVLAAIAVWLIVNCGGQLFNYVLNSGGPWIIGVIAIGLVCLVAFPICIVGTQLRVCWDYKRQGHPIPLRKVEIFIIVGMLILVVGIFVLMSAFGSGKAALAFGIFALIALGTGWSGHFWVPELE